MGLAYNLNVDNLLNVQNLSNAIISSPIVGITMFGGLGNDRFLSSGGTCQQIYPTGEYIIRDGLFANGIYIYVGSYKAYIRDLFGAGSHGYAWDGFIMTMRGYSINQPNGFNIMNSAGIPEDQNFGFLPMRMPIEVNPGAVGDAVAIAADSSVGLQSLDIYKSVDDVYVQSSDPSIRIITCGFQRIDATAEGVPTGSDYVGNLYLAELLTYDNYENPTPAGSNYVSYIYNPNNVMQVTWKASQAGHADNTNLVGRFGNLRDLDEGLAGNEPTMAGIPYLYGQWLDGQLPDGTNPSGGPVFGTDRSLIAWNQFPRRFLDITCSSQQPTSVSENVGSTFFIVGDLAADTNDDGSIDDTGPMLIGGAFEFPAAWDRMISGSSPFDYLPPYLITHPALVTSLTTTAGGTSSWFREGAVPSYTFSGAVAALVSVPYEEASFATPPLTFIGVNDVSHSGTDYAEIYYTDASPIKPGGMVAPYATEGGAFTTATSISLPNKWYNKAVQQRTFSIDEEDLAKYGTLDSQSGEFTPTEFSIKDDDAGDYIGYVSNYQRYGLTDDPEATGIGIVQGTISRNGYGFLGFKTGTGPIAIMFDSGAATISGVAPTTFTGIVLAEGANLNTNHLVSPTSTTRKIVNAGWDNDRDQWLFISSDTTGAGVISVSADFSTAANNVGFLDQTTNFDNNNFPLSTTANAGLYIPNSMTNALDGFVCFGIFDDDANCRFGIKPILGASTAESDTCDAVTVSYDFYLNASSYFYRITGTTGRQAKVWVDYILFDGADAVIATKLRERGMKVSIEAVEWFKRKIIHSGDLNIKQEEIELWMREQQDEFSQMMQDAERQGRVRKRKKQVSAYGLDLSEVLTPDFEDKEVQEFMKEYLPQSRPPTPEEQAIEKQRKGGYAPFSKNYYDEVFEN